MRVRRRCWRRRGLPKSLHPVPPKPPLKTRILRWGGIAALTIFAALVLRYTDEIRPEWVRWALVILVGIAVATLTRSLEPKPQPAWVEGPDDNQTLVYASYWPGDVLATPESIRAAMLTALRNWQATVIVMRPGGSRLQAQNDDEGWRIVSWQVGGGDHLVGCRADGQAVVDPPRGLMKYLTDKGGVFTFDEAFTVLNSFAATGSASSLVDWRVRSEIE